MRYWETISASRPKHATWCHSVRCWRSPEALSFQYSLVATRRVATAVPLFGVCRSSGSAPKQPINSVFFQRSFTHSHLRYLAIYPAKACGLPSRSVAEALMESAFRVLALRSHRSSCLPRHGTGDNSDLRINGDPHAGNRTPIPHRLSATYCGISLSSTKIGRVRTGKRCPGSVSRRAYAWLATVFTAVACVAARWFEGCCCVAQMWIRQTHGSCEAGPGRVDNNVWIDRLTPARPCPIREALHRSLTAAATVEGGLLSDPELRIWKKAPSSKRP